MKKNILCASFVLVFLSTQAQLGAINSYSLGNNDWGNSFWGNTSGNYGYNNYNSRTNYQTSYLYNYNGFSFTNDGVNISVNTPWGGGNISFPVGRVHQNDEYVYKTPRQVRDNYISTNNTTVSDIDYSDRNLAMNQVNASTTTPPTVQTTTTEVYMRTFHWVKKVVSTTVSIYVRTDANGQAFYKTEFIENEQWVLE